MSRPLPSLRLPRSFVLPEPTVPSFVTPNCKSRVLFTTEIAERPSMSPQAKPPDPTSSLTRSPAPIAATDTPLRNLGHQMEHAHWYLRTIVVSPSISCELRTRHQCSLRHADPSSQPLAVFFSRRRDSLGTTMDVYPTRLDAFLRMVSWRRAFESSLFRVRSRRQGPSCPAAGRCGSSAASKLPYR
jgi:hypothetical protein